MRIYDISVGISPQLPVWPGDPPVELERVQAIALGANANVSRLGCGVHIGTHVDAPLHFIDGAAGVETLPLKLLTGRAYVVYLPAAKVIDEATLEKAGLPPRTRRVLFRTRNSEIWAREKAFQKDFVAVDASGARWLVKKASSSSAWTTSPWRRTDRARRRIAHCSRRGSSSSRGWTSAM